MRIVSGDELTALMDRIKRGFGLVPVAIISAEFATREAGAKLALTPYEKLPVIKKPREREQDKESEPEPESVPAPRSAYAPNNALYISGTVRSGQRIVHDNHLIICGDVNPGAEVVAGGDIIVMGSLRGLAHAGYFGDETARIVAGNLRPPQLRIAGKIARAPEESGQAGGANRGSETARIESGEIGVFPL